MLVARIVHRTPWRNVAWLSLLVALATLVRLALFWAVMGGEHRAPPLGTAEIHAACWSMLLDALAALIVLVAFRRLRPPDVEHR